jgi:signal transduction histidine kinase
MRLFKSFKFEDKSIEQQFASDSEARSKTFLNSIWLPAIAFITLLLIRDLFLGMNSNAEIFASALRAILLIFSAVLYVYGRRSTTQLSDYFHLAVKVWVAVATAVLVAIAASQSLESEARYYRALLGYLVVLCLFATYFRARATPLYLILIAGWLTISYLFKTIANNNLEAFVSGQATFVGMLIVVLSFNRTLERSERRAFQASLNLSNANEELKKASIEKSNFLISISHDLRQPLTGLVGYLDLTRMHAQKLKDPILDAYLDGALRGSNLISLNLTSVLDLSRIQDERFLPKLEPTRIEDTLRNVCGLLEAKAIAENIQLKLVLPTADVQWIDSDQIVLGQVFQNVIANALQYRRVGLTRSWVLVSCVRLSEKVLRVTIIDNGIGISPEYHTKIFEPHFQIHNPSRSVGKGFGLGLAFVAQSIKRLHNHGLTIASDGRTYTKFNIYLPISASPKVLSSIQPSTVQPTLNLAEPNRFKYGHIVLFEDSENIRSLFRHIADKFKIELIEFESFDDVDEIQLQKLTKLKNDLLIISDYRLIGVGNGCETIVKLRVLLGIEVPALVITGDLKFDSGLLPSNTSLLKKPFGLPQLIQLM